MRNRLTLDARPILARFRCPDLTATDGANLGDAMSFAGELELDDTYELDRRRAAVQRPSVLADDPVFEIARRNPIGTPGAALHLDCALTLMSPDGQTTDASCWSKPIPSGHVHRFYLLPLAPLAPRTDYALVGIDSENAASKFARGRLRPLYPRHPYHAGLGRAGCRSRSWRVGDRVLTRDDGPQQVRWIGQSTVRAVGDFAPIRIRRAR